MTRRLLFALYATVPAVAFFLPLRNGTTEWWKMLLAAPFNYIFFAFPLLLWLVIVRLGKLTPPVLHAGMLGITLTLLVLTVAFSFYINNENAMGWIVYYPLAAVVSSISAVLAYAFSPSDRPSA